MAIYSGVLLNENDLTSPFLCDVQKCKGACCFIEGELGAPLKNEEVSTINSLIPKILHLLPQTSVKVIKEQGGVIRYNNKYFTNVLNNRECVFAFFENGIARCAFEYEYLRGEINFRKPISCHLFPIREYTFLFTELVYVKLPECRDGIACGIENEQPLYVSLKEALVRRFGEEWYKGLEKKLNNSNNNFI